MAQSSVSIDKSRQVDFEIRRGMAINRTLVILNADRSFRDFSDVTAAEFEVFKTSYGEPRVISQTPIDSYTLNNGISLSEGQILIETDVLNLYKNQYIYKLHLTTPSKGRVLWFNGLIKLSDTTGDPPDEFLEIIVPLDEEEVVVQLNSQWLESLDNFIEALDRSAESGKPVTLYGGTEVDLQGTTVNIPFGASLQFNGGFIKNGTLVGNRTQVKAGIEKIFETTITLEGTWAMDFICPQHFGAKTNASMIDVNPCEVHMAKCIESRIRPYWPPGFYCVDDETVIDFPLTIELAGRNFPDGWDRTDGVQVPILPDHARIYTFKNVPIFRAKANSISFLGGVLDVSKVTDYTSDAVIYDINAKIWTGLWDSHIVGKSSGLASRDGGTGIRFDQRNITELDGFAVDITLRGSISYMGRGIYGDDLAPGMRTYVNSLYINTKINGCKQPIHFESLDNSYIQPWVQCRQVLGSGEEDFPAVYLNGVNNLINPLLFDLDRPYNPSTGGIGNSRGVVLDGNSHYLGIEGEILRRNGKIEGLDKIATSTIINPQGSVISKDMISPTGVIISRLNTETAAFASRHTVTIKRFKGAGKDFENDLDPTSGSETSDITILNQENLFKASGLPCGIRFNSGADLDNDFVEIEMTPSSGTFQWFKAIIHLYQYINYANRIQFIEHYSNATKQQWTFEIDELRRLKSTYFFENLPNLASTKTLIRIIGGAVQGSATEPIYINDICLIRSQPQTLPYLTIEGGQTIYGSLQTSQFRQSTWSYTNPLVLGGISLFPDSSNRLRMKVGTPSNETDGTIVGSQS